MEILKEMEKSALAEFGNISIGSSATALSNLLNQRVSITIPQVKSSTLEEIKKSYPIPCIVVEVEYVEGLSCKNLLIINEKDAAIIANLMMGVSTETEVKELDEIQISAVSEAMNQMMGSAATAISELFNRYINISPPKIEYLDLNNFTMEDKEFTAHSLIEIKFRMEISNLIDSQLLLLIPETFAKEAASKLIGDYHIPGEENGTGAEDESSTDSFEIPEESLMVEKQEPGKITAETPGEKQNNLDFSEEEIDALREIGNISMGSAATALSTLLDKRVSLTTPSFKTTSLEEVRDNYPIPCVVVEVQYCEGFEGQNILIIKEEDARIIAGIMMGEDLDRMPKQLNEIQLSAVSEAMNQMMGSASTAMSDLFSFPVHITPPSSRYKNLNKEDVPAIIGDDFKLIQISFRMEVGNLIDSELIQLLPLSFSKKMASRLLQGMSLMGGRLEVEEEMIVSEELVSSLKQEEDISNQEVEEDISFLFSDENNKDSPGSKDAPCSFRETLVGEEGIELIKDIPVRITGIMGRTGMKLKKIQQLNEGSVVELDRLEGEPIDILANNKPIARGEIVVVEEQFGVRITEIIRLESKL